MIGSVEQPPIMRDTLADRIRNALKHADEMDGAVGSDPADPGEKTTGMTDEEFEKLLARREQISFPESASV